MFGIAEAFIKNKNGRVKRRLNNECNNENSKASILNKIFFSDIVETAESAAIRDYKYIINNITKCNLYSFNCLSDTYFNSSVISDIVDKYLNGDISKEKFIRQLSAATEIYLTE